MLIFAIFYPECYFAVFIFKNKNKIQKFETTPFDPLKILFQFLFNFIYFIHSKINVFKQAIQTIEIAV